MKYLLSLLFALVLFSSCSKFQRLMKSTDLDAKYQAAVKYYDKKDYYRSLQLFEELITIYRGTAKAEDAYYYYTYCTYYVDDYVMAAYNFNNFVTTFPSSKRAEEMQYMYAYCYYKDSPVYSLDQTNTMDAIEKFQLFINKYPKSEKVPDANQRIDELRAKLEEKGFNNAKLYYQTEKYNAACYAFESFLKDFPGSQYKEDCMYLELRSAYLLADGSVQSRQKERYQAAVDQYLKFIDNFPKSRYLREAEKMYDTSKKSLNN